MHRASAGSYGRGGSYQRGTPVVASTLVAHETEAGIEGLEALTSLLAPVDFARKRSLGVVSARQCCMPPPDPPIPQRIVASRFSGFY